MPTIPQPAKVHPRPARQIRGLKVSNFLPEPRQFQAQKNLRDFEFGPLFLARRRAYHESLLIYTWPLTNEQAKPRFSDQNITADELREPPMEINFIPSTSSCG
jgi:hypothetical protein